MFSKFKEIIRGINAINTTPFTENKEIDWELLGQNIDYLLTNGIKAIYPCGNTGEFYSLTIEEAKEVTRFVVERNKGRAKVIAGIGYDYKTASHLAKYYEDIGADGIMIHQPINPFMQENGLIEYYNSIATSTHLPILLYVRQQNITINVLRQVAQLPNVVGIKYAVNDLISFAKTVQEVNEDVVWVCGSAEMWTPFFFIAGAEGFTSGLVNVDTKRSFQLLDALKDKRFTEAMQIWNEIRPFEELRERYMNGNNVSVVKEAMNQLGLSNGVVRAPLSRLSTEEVNELKVTLKDWGILTELTK
ncbi:dihydrodipicolinate synthase family protein [Bacillus timonensis]|uniref:dihydrodipicolinate synthase family protein n=1 Tax=Bacillus timonensis TaxID=1033734 RepID=UPI000287BB84|nr:dihydrodipicolinate synthase family protein [Bacillus timonensis]